MLNSKIIITICVLTITNSLALAELPDHFDWRNVNGKDWMTDVKDQGLCGSCWAFTAVAVVEAQYDIFWDWPDYDIDLSEENLVSVNCFYSDCRGGWHNQALGYIRDSGITDEACFLYVDSNCTPECGCAHGCSNAERSDRCAEWETRLWKIDGTQYVSSSVEAIKNYLYTEGPIAVSFDFNDVRGYWDGDIWRCTNPLEHTHCVVLVGWDETGDYWIAKNSYGDDWNGDGYFKIGFGECFVQNIAYGATLNNPDVDKFYVGSNAWFGDLGNAVLTGTFTSGGTCIAPSGSFIIKNSVGETVAYIDSAGDMCIEGGLYENQGTLTPPSGSFIVEDSTGATVAYIDDSGNLYLKRKLYQNP